MNLINHSRHWIIGLSLMLGFNVSTPTDNPKPATESQDFWELQGYRISDTPSKDLKGYRPLKKILVAFAPPEFLQRLKSDFPDIEFVMASELDAKATNLPFDAVMLSCGNPQALTQAGNIAWLLSYSAGVENCLAHPSVAKRNSSDKPVIVTNSSGTAASVIGEHAIAMMMSLARGLHRFRDQQHKSRWSRDLLAEGNLTSTVGGKTMLVLGLGAIGKAVARRADALGMRVIATRNSSRNGPDYVGYVGLADETLELAKQADVVVNALPLTESTKGLVDDKFFAAMKPTAFIVSVGRGGTTDTKALLDALNNKTIAGAALDVTDPEPLPKNHPLWQQQNVIITPHLAGSGGEARDKTFALIIENIRRYQVGEPLLNLVDIDLGY